MNHLYTIGAYGFDAGTFFDTLQSNEIDVLLDVRRRRGIRGREYAFGNAGRLTEQLESRGIVYRHLLDLAPLQETRELQNQADEASKQPKRLRGVLAEAFVEDYTRRTLDPFDFDALVEDLRPFRRPVLFCVEGNPHACHRSLAAARLSGAAGVPVTHLVP